jgi:uncharacterized protein (TIGR03437 family)
MRAEFIQRVSKIIVLLGLGAGLWANPIIYPHSVLNAASYQAPGLPSGSIAQGSVFTIFGAVLGPSTAAQQSSFPLQTTFSSVSIQVTQGSQTVSAIPLFVSAGQINALMPSNTPLGWVSVVVTYNNAKSNPSPVYIVHDSPGIFTFTGTGLGPAALQNAITATNLPNNSTQSAAKPGQLEILYLTGLGPISGADSGAPPVGNLATPVEIWVGDVPAAVTYSGRSPCCSGLDQINFTVPANAPQGCWVPVWVRTSHATISNFTSMAIGPNGGACSDTSNPYAATVVNGGSLGLLALTRLTVHEDLGVNTQVDVTNDFVNYTATKQPGGPFAFSPWLSTPPKGTCTVYQGTGDYLSTGTVPAAGQALLDGGTSVNVSGPGGQQSATLGAGNSAALGTYMPLYSFPNQLFLTPGAYTVTTSGGADIGAIDATIAVPASLSWTNRDQIVMVDRTQSLVLNWTGTTASQTVTVIGIDSDLPTNSSAMFLCSTPAGASTFTVPPEVLGAIPASRPNALSSKAVIYLISSSPAAVSASGLTNGQASAVYIGGKTVAFK